LIRGASQEKGKTMAREYYKQCAQCGKLLWPEDAVVYLRTGVKGIPVERWAVACLCSPTVEQMKNQEGSPCVHAFRKLYTMRGYTITNGDDGVRR